MLLVGVAALPLLGPIAAFCGFHFLPGHFFAFLLPFLCVLEWL
jgi:hypothetical protein